MTNILDKEFTIGTWITLGHPAIAEILSSVGFDWIAVDLEHSSITIREAEELIRIIDLKGTVPLVRLTANNSEQIKRVMDAGSHGIIVPMVKSKEDAQVAVASVKYPPVGERSVGLARAQSYGQEFKKYEQWQGTGSIVIVQIEHIDAVDNLEEILSVEGVNGYIVGPYDLSGSLGKPGDFESKEFLEAILKIRTVGNKMGLPGGRHLIEPVPADLIKCIEEGNRFIAYSLDIRMLDVSARQGLDVVFKKRT